MRSLGLYREVSGEKEMYMVYGGGMDSLRVGVTHVFLLGLVVRLVLTAVSWRYGGFQSPFDILYFLYFPLENMDVGEMRCCARTIASP